MARDNPQSERLLSVAEVASMFRVDPKTITRWAKIGRLSSIRTIGGHRRYRETEVRALLAGIPVRSEASSDSLPPSDQQSRYRISIPTPDSSSGLEAEYSIVVYIADDDAVKARDFLMALDEVFADNGIALIPEGPPELGSWFQKFRIKFSDVAASDEAKRLLAKSEVALQAALLDEPQSRTNEHQANAVAHLIDAAKDVNTFVTLTGSILLIKQTDRTGRVSVISKTLLPEEVLFLERNPEAFRSPEGLMASLAMRSDIRSIYEA